MSTKAKAYYRLRRSRLQITMPLLSFRWPEDAAHVQAHFWRAGTAAKAWRCSYRAAVRWFREHAGALVILRLRHAGGACAHWVCVVAGQRREAAVSSPAASPLVAYALQRARATTVARQMLATVPVVRYTMPRDRAKLLSTFWGPAEAARAWRCSYQAARRWLLLHPDHAVLVQLVRPDGSMRARLCMLAGQERIRAPQGGRGNPTWQDSETQAALASRRWKRQRLTPSPDAPPWD